MMVGSWWLAHGSTFRSLEFGDQPWIVNNRHRSIPNSHRKSWTSIREHEAISQASQQYDRQKNRFQPVIRIKGRAIRDDSTHCGLTFGIRNLRRWCWDHLTIPTTILNTHHIDFQNISRSRSKPGILLDSTSYQWEEITRWCPIVS